MTGWNVPETAGTLHRQALVWNSHSGFEPEPDADLDQLERGHHGDQRF